MYLLSINIYVLIYLKYNFNNRSFKMNKEKLDLIHQKRYLNDDWREVTSSFENTNNLQFFLNDKDFSQGRIVAKCFTNRSSKNRWYYQFKTYENFERKVRETIEDNNSSLKIKEEYKKERLKPHTLKVGDILCCSWGYDQTNVDFYIVTQLVGKNSVKIAQVGNITEENGYNDLTRPSNNIISGEMLYRVNGRNNSITLNSYSWARPFDGKPMYQTNPYNGH